MVIFIMGQISMINLPSTYIVTRLPSFSGKYRSFFFFFFFDRQQKNIINNHSQLKYTGNVLKGQKSRTKIVIVVSFFQL